MLLDINILMSERIAVNLHHHHFTIEFCQNLMANIMISSKSHLIKRALKIASKTIILLRSAVLILISNILKKCQPQFNKDYIFTLKRQLKLELTLLPAIMHAGT